MRALRPLRHRDFRLLWAGLAVSLVGDGLWLVALAWQVIELGGGPVQLSLVTALFSLGLLTCILLGGVVADRVPRRRIMLTADLVRAVVVVVLGTLSVTGGLEIWQLAVGGLLIGAAEAFFVPAFTALVPELLPEDQLLAANGLEGVIRPLSQQAVGPALGGLLVATVGPGPAMIGNALSYAISAACLFAMLPTPRPAAVDRSGAHPAASMLRELREGVAYVRGERWLWATLLFALVAILFILGPIEVLLPFAVRDHAGSDASGYGLLLALYGIGSALGALAISARRLPRRYLSWMILMWGLGALPLVLIGWLEVLWAMAVVTFVVGVTDTAGQVIWGTLLQRRVPNRLRGRVSSLDWFVSLGLLPVSMALAGPAGELLGLGPVFVAAGVAPAIAGLLILYGLGLHRDELGHPLDEPEDEAPAGGAETGDGRIVG